jgi:hypothetical protein
MLTTSKETDRQGDNYKKDLIGITTLQRNTEADIEIYPRRDEMYVRKIWKVRKSQDRYLHEVKLQRGEGKYI